jgi:hypothetical protein
MSKGTLRQSINQSINQSIKSNQITHIHHNFFSPTSVHAQAIISKCLPVGTLSPSLSWSQSSASFHASASSFPSGTSLHSSEYLFASQSGSCGFESSTSTLPNFLPLGSSAYTLAKTLADEETDSLVSIRGREEDIVFLLSRGLKPPFALKAARCAGQVTSSHSRKTSIAARISAVLAAPSAAFFMAGWCLARLYMVLTVWNWQMSDRLLMRSRVFSAAALSLKPVPRMVVEGLSSVYRWEGLGSALALALVGEVRAPAARPFFGAALGMAENGEREVMFLCLREMRKREL